LLFHRLLAFLRRRERQFRFENVASTLFARMSAAIRRCVFRGERNRWAVSVRLRSSAASTKATSPAPRRRIMTGSRDTATWSVRAARVARALVYVVSVGMALFPSCTDTRSRMRGTTSRGKLVRGMASVHLAIILGDPLRRVRRQLPEEVSLHPLLRSRVIGP